MNDAGNWSLTTIINIGHGTGDGTCGWDSAKEWGSEVSQTLGYQLGITVMMIADDTIGYGCRKQTLDSTQNGDGNCWRYETLDSLPVHLWNLGCRQLIADREAVTDGFYALYTSKLLEQ